MTRSENMEHVEVLERLRDRWAMPGECAALGAAIASLSAPQSGDWVLVPREPTPGMLEDGGIEFAMTAQRLQTAERCAGDIYRAMLAAAQQPPAEPTNRAESSSKLVDGQPPAEAQPVSAGDPPHCPSCDCPAGVNVPPAEAQPVGVEGVEAALQKWLDWCNEHDEEPEARSGAKIAIEALAQQPPSAPVGVAADILRIVDTAIDVCNDRDRPAMAEDLEAVRLYVEQASAPLAQQPAACTHSWHDYGTVNRAWCSRCNAVAVIGHEDRPYGALTVTDDGEYRTNPTQQPAAVDRSWDELEIIVKGYLDDPHADAEYALRKIAVLAAQQGGEK